MTEKTQEKKSLKIEILEQMAKLITTGFGIVAALAWNEAIKALFVKIFPRPEDNLLAMFGYAIIITILIVVATLQVSRLINIAKKQLKDQNSAIADGQNDLKNNE